MSFPSRANDSTSVDPSAMKDAFTRARRWAITRWQTVIRVIPAEESRAAWKAYLDTWKAGRSSDRQGWIRRWVVNSRLRRAGHALDLPQEEGVKKMRHWFYIKGRLKRRQRTPRCRSNDPDQHTPMQFHRRCIVADAFTSRPRATRVFFFPGRGERGETPFDIFASAFGGKCWRERESIARGYPAGSCVIIELLNFSRLLITLSDDRSEREGCVLTSPVRRSYFYEVKAQCYEVTSLPSPLMNAPRIFAWPVFPSRGDDI